MSIQILIVEDERLVAKHISQLLQDDGYTICAIASDGDTAMKKIVEFSPDLVLLDIQIKGEIDGVEVAEQILWDMYLNLFAANNYSLQSW
jgi:DNA-binding response OmpR family regulator